MIGLTISWLSVGLHSWFSNRWAWQYWIYLFFSFVPRYFCSFVYLIVLLLFPLTSSCAHTHSPLPEGKTLCLISLVPPVTFSLPFLLSLSSSSLPQTFHHPSPPQLSDPTPSFLPHAVFTCLLSSGTSLIQGSTWSFIKCFPEHGCFTELKP